jgi:hypothetical protein
MMDDRRFIAIAVPALLFATGVVAIAVLGYGYGLGAAAHLADV